MPEVFAEDRVGGYGARSYVDWADSILETPLRIVDGMAVVTEGPGNGLRWNEVVVARYRLD